MNKISYYAFAGMFALAATMTACGDDEEENNNGGGTTTTSAILFNNGTEIGNGDQEFEFKGTETIKKGTYLMKGWVYITSGSTLTIEPGTVIKGDKDTKAALVVEPGGKLIAQGTASEPIVFTSEQPAGSRKPGDWGGIIICGNARNNQTDMQIEGGPRTHHGGTNDADNSGVLSYVRIEFAGYPFQKDKEINGLTLGSVGSGTKIDHVQVSYSNDDSFEWFGGTVNCKYLIAYKGWDDDFDTDNGFSGTVQYGFALRDSKIADTSQSNGFESDNCADGASASPWTTAQFSNITFVGPKYDTNFQNDVKYITGGDYNPNNGSALGRFQAGMHIRRNSKLNCYNSVVLDWPIGLILDNEKGNTQGNANNGDMHLNNIWIANYDIVGSDYNKVYKDSLYNYETKKVDPTQTSFTSGWFKEQTGNKTYADKSSLQLTDGLSIGGGATYMPTSGSPLIGAASFSNLSGFDTVNYIGAFKANDNWTAGWANFDPQNTAY